MKSIEVKSLIIGILGSALVMVLVGQTNLKNSYQIVCVQSLTNTLITETEGDILCRRFDLHKKKTFMKTPDYYDTMRFQAKAFVGEL